MARKRKTFKTHKSHVRGKMGKFFVGRAYRKISNKERIELERRFDHAEQEQTI